MEGVWIIHVGASVLLQCPVAALHKYTHLGTHTCTHLVLLNCNIFQLKICMYSNRDSKAHQFFMLEMNERLSKVCRLLLYRVGQCTLSKGGKSLHMSLFYNLWENQPKIQTKSKSGSQGRDRELGWLLIRPGNQSLTTRLHPTGSCSECSLNTTPVYVSHHVCVCMCVHRPAVTERALETARSPSASSWSSGWKELSLMSPPLTSRGNDRANKHTS